MIELPRIYVDTSFYFNVLTDQWFAQRSEALMRAKLPCSSTLLLLEAERNLIRLSREQKLSIQDFSLCKQKLMDDSQAIILKEFTVDLCLTGLYPAIQTPRSGDMAHLRTANWFKQNGGLESFVTSDERQKLAADELGLPAICFRRN